MVKDGGALERLAEVDHRRLRQNRDPDARRATLVDGDAIDPDALESLRRWRGIRAIRIPWALAAVGQSPFAPRRSMAGLPEHPGSGLEGSIGRSSIGSADPNGHWRTRRRRMLVGDGNARPVRGRPMSGDIRIPGRASSGCSRGGRRTRPGWMPWRPCLATGRAGPATGVNARRPPLSRGVAGREADLYRLDRRLGTQGSDGRRRT